MSNKIENKIIDNTESSVESPTVFTGGKAKQTSYRGLIVAGVMAAILIAFMFFLSHVVTGFREQWATERAEKATKAKEMSNSGARDGRLFPDTVAVSTALPVVQQARQDTEPIPLRSSSPAPASPALPLPVAQQGYASSIPLLVKPAQLSMIDIDPPPESAPVQAGRHAGGSPDQSDTNRTKFVQAQALLEAKGKPATTTAQATAANLGDRSFLLARGSWIPCILETQLNSTIAGATSCVIPENVYSDNGKTILIEKGSRSQGTFGNTLKVGDERIAVMWDRIKTTMGIVIDVNSPIADGVGTTGTGGYVENHWGQRIGAAVLLSFIQDAIGFSVANSQKSSNSASQSAGSTNVYLPNNSISASNKLAEKILDSTINIAPTLYKNRGERIMIFVNRDMWFDSTYKLVMEK